MTFEGDLCRGHAIFLGGINQITTVSCWWFFTKPFEKYSASQNGWKSSPTRWNHHLSFNGCFNWIIANLYMGNGCLGFQVLVTAPLNLHEVSINGEALQVTPATVTQPTSSSWPVIFHFHRFRRCPYHGNTVRVHPIVPWNASERFQISYQVCLEERQLLSEHFPEMDWSM